MNAQSVEPSRMESRMNTAIYAKLLRRYRSMDDDSEAQNTRTPRLTCWLDHRAVDANFWREVESDYPSGTVEDFAAWLAP